jgi:hypothetical protein
LNQDRLPQLQYQELDASTIPGTDREVASFILPPSNSRTLKYDILISFRGVDERETLAMSSPPDHVDWQYKTNLKWKGETVIDCEDPRFPTANQSQLPQCFPEYEGRLPQLVGEK